MKQGVKVAFISVYIAEYKVFLCTAMDRLFPGQFYALHGQERPGTRPRDYGPLPIQNNIAVKNRFLVFKGIDLTWTPGVWWMLVNRPSVVILGDGVRVISNYFMHFVGKLTGAKIIYYTHGYNHQAVFTRSARVASASERIRRFLFAHSDALIVYAQANKSYLEACGIRTKIFVSPNTLDTPTLLARRANVSQDALEALRRSLGVKEGQHIIVFLGRLVPEKEVDLFVDVIRQLERAEKSRYVGLVVGDGPSLTHLKEYSEGLFIHFAGHQSGQALMNHLVCADCVFIPSHVGLAVIEAFCAGKPFVTCKGRHHSPEIDYVRHGINGLIIDAPDPSDIAREIARLLNDQDKLKQMSHEASITARALHPDASIEGFVQAIGYVRSAEMTASSPL
jgi:glycosyltransferase involved in cell wall biosynthesis